MLLRRSAASRRTRSRSALNSSPCTYSLTRFTRASERSSEMISAEVCLKNLLAIGLLLLLHQIVPPGGGRGYPLAACVTSLTTIRPPEPVPSRPERSTPSSSALFLAAFVASGVPDSSPAGGPEA